MRSTRNIARRGGVAVALSAITVLVAGCSSADSDGVSPPTATASSSLVTDPSSAATPAATPRSCSSSGSSVPSDARTAPTIDVDDDGRADEQWVTPGGEFGITTASGRTASVRPTDFSGGAEPAALVADATGAGDVVMLVSGSREVDLYRWIDCTLAPVTDTHGDPYRFDLTGQNGTGVGCINVDGARHLVGLLASQPAGAPGDAGSIAVTIIELDGTTATNGPTMTGAPAGDAMDAASRVSCGDRILEDDGISIVQPAR